MGLSGRGPDWQIGAVLFYLIPALFAILDRPCRLKAVPRRVRMPASVSVLATFAQLLRWARSSATCCRTACSCSFFDEFPVLAGFIAIVGIAGGFSLRLEILQNGAGALSDNLSIPLRY